MLAVVTYVIDCAQEILSRVIRRVTGIDQVDVTTTIDHPAIAERPIRMESNELNLTGSHGSLGTS
jgi:hypothetical protein